MSNSPDKWGNARLSGNPSLASVWQLLELRRPALAETAARQRLAADPEDWQALLALTEALHQLKRLDEAISTASAAVRAAPIESEAHFALAQACGVQGRLREADASVLEALRLNSRRPCYYAFRAQLFYLRRSYSAAINCAEEGLLLDPQHADCLLWRAMAQEKRDLQESADEDFRRLLRVAPESAPVHAHLGLVMLKRFQPAAADCHLTEALRQDPNLAAKLVPLLRQVRRQQLWPDWLLQSERICAERRALGIDPGVKVLLNRIAGSGIVLQAWWRTRRDPLFRQRLPPNPHTRNQWRWRLKVWAVVVAIIAGIVALTVASVQLGFPAVTGILLASGLLAIARYLQERREAD